MALLAMKNGQVPTYFLRLLKALSLELWLRDVVARHVVLFRDRCPSSWLQIWLSREFDLHSKSVHRLTVDVNGLPC